MSSSADQDLVVPQSCIISCADALLKKPEWRSRYDIDLIYNFLKRLPIFHNAHPFVLRELCSYVHYEYICRDVILFRNGDPGLNWYIVLSGTLHLKQSPYADTDDAATSKLYSGSMFGVQEILSESKHNVTVCTADDVELLRIERTDFLYLWNNYRLIMEQLVQVATDADGYGDELSAEPRVQDDVRLSKASSVHSPANGHAVQQASEATSGARSSPANDDTRTCISPTIVSLSVSSMPHASAAAVSSGRTQSTSAMNSSSLARTYSNPLHVVRQRSLANIDLSQRAHDPVNSELQQSLTSRNHADSCAMQRYLAVLEQSSIKERLRYYAKVLRTSLLASHQSIIRDQFVHLVRGQTDTTRTVCYPQCMQGSALFSWLRSLLETYSRRVLSVGNGEEQQQTALANGHAHTSKLTCYRVLQMLVDMNLLYDVAPTPNGGLATGQNSARSPYASGAFQNASDRFYRFACDNQGVIPACGELERSVAECEVMLLLDALLCEADRFWFCILLRKAPYLRTAADIDFAVQHLRNMATFDAVTDAQLQLYARYSTTETYKIPGTVVRSKSEVMEHFNVVLSGSFCIERLCDQSFTMLQEGDTFGRRMRSDTAVDACSNQHEDLEMRAHVIARDSYSRLLLLSLTDLEQIQKVLDHVTWRFSAGDETNRTAFVYQCTGCLVRNCVLNHSAITKNAVVMLPLVKSIGSHLVWTAVKTLSEAEVRDAELPSLTSAVLLVGPLCFSDEQLAASLSKIWDEEKNLRFGVAQLLLKLWRINPRCSSYACGQLEQRLENCVTRAASGATNCGASDSLTESCERLLNQKRSIKQFQVTTLKVFSTSQMCVTFEARLDASCKQILEDALALLHGKNSPKDVTNYRLYELKSTGELVHFELEEYGIPTRMSLNGKLLVLQRSQSLKAAVSTFTVNQPVCSSYAQLMATKSHELANALTAHSMRLFLDVPEIELLLCACREPVCGRVEREWLTPHLDRLLRDAALLRSWTQTQIALTPLGKEQVRLMRKLIKVASILYEMSNFHALFAIFGALIEEPVGRVARAALSRLSPHNTGDLKLVAAYGHLRQFVIDPLLRAYDYRSRTTIDAHQSAVKLGAQLVTKAGFIPHTPHVLQELKRINGRMPWTDEEQLISVQKMVRLADAVQRFALCKHICAISDLSSRRTKTKDEDGACVRCIYAADCIDDAKRLVEHLRKL